MLELIVDPQVAGQAPWRAELRREVARMLTAASRAEAASAVAARAARSVKAARGGKRPSAVIALQASLRLTDDATIRELNREFRHKDKATDVLAFAQREGPWAGAGKELLGDIVISLATARRQARRKTPAGVHAEVRFLASHGLCHLLGYDHRDDAEEREMNARAAALRAEARRRGRIRAA